MNYTILVIDDDDAMHYMVKKILGDEFKLLHVRNAQGGINALSEHPVNLVLSDIHMPEMNGLEFLEIITTDADKKNVPVLIMTSLPTVEKEQKAVNLGAADFINKELFNTTPEVLAEKIRLKLLTHVDVPDISKRLELNFKMIAKEIMFEVSAGDFLSTSKKVCSELEDNFKLDHISFWTISKTAPYLILANGLQPPANYNPRKLLEEPTYNLIADERKPYLNNNILNDDNGLFLEMSRENNLPAEIGVPIYCITEKELIRNKMKIPATTRAFGYVVIKRKTVFTTKEYQLISKLLIQTGSVMWRLYQEM